MYEVALTEWRLPPEYINRHWTEELLQLMFLKRNVRLRRIAKRPGDPEPKPTPKFISNEEFFKKHNIPVTRR